MRPLTYGQDVPTWAVNILERFRQALADRPTSPVKAARFTTATVPPAASWPAAVIFNTSTGALYQSDGTSWQRLVTLPLATALAVAL